ncbi:MAG TPA: HypC/HybG/HupF family hydrogenase formation chaperone [Aggregatilineales bacterium]|nr:HypC/HybG/HupF family hydrogenase formation chaperone [Aggregatilineales bacterium]
MCLAVPGKIIKILSEDPIMRTGKVSFGGIIKEVNLAYVPEAQIGDYVIVHVGFAIETLDESEANRVFDYLDEMGELEELNVGESGSETDPFERSAPR